MCVRACVRVCVCVRVHLLRARIAGRKDPVAGP